MLQALLKLGKGLSVTLLSVQLHSGESRTLVEGGADLPLAARLAPVARVALRMQLLAQVPKRGMHAAAVPVVERGLCITV